MVVRFAGVCVYSCYKIIYFGMLVTIVLGFVQIVFGLVLALGGCYCTLICATVLIVISTDEGWIVMSTNVLVTIIWRDGHGVVAFAFGSRG